MVPSAMPSVASSPYFTLVSASNGDNTCATTDNGTCIESPDYTDNDRCEWSVNTDVLLTVEYFLIEDGHDFVYVYADGADDTSADAYDARTGPDGVSVRAGGKIVFDTDSSVAPGTATDDYYENKLLGFRICAMEIQITRAPTSVPSSSPSGAPSFAPSSSPSGAPSASLAPSPEQGMFTLVSASNGDNTCATTDNGFCIESADYTDNDLCEWTVTRDATLTVEYFLIERGFDYLYIYEDDLDTDSDAYTGTTGPSGVTVSTGGSIVFDTDNSVSLGTAGDDYYENNLLGFRICGVDA